MMLGEVGGSKDFQDTFEPTQVIAPYKSEMWT